MRKNPICQSQLTLIDIWDNIFFKLSSAIVGNDSKADFFIISDSVDTYEITRATNKVEKLNCMIDSSISWYSNKITDNYGRYTQEYKAFVSALNSGYIKYEDKGHAKRYVNLRYEELLNYLTKKGKKVIIDEVDFLKKMIVNSCVLKLYLNEKTHNGFISNEYRVKKSEIDEFKEKFNVEKIEKLARQFLSKYYIEMDQIDVFELLAVIILRTLVEIYVDDNLGRELAKSESIRNLQEDFIKIIEEYLEETNGVYSLDMDESLLEDWATKFGDVRRELVEVSKFSESSEFIQSLDRLYEMRSNEIKLTAFENFGLITRLEISKLVITLNEEMKELDKLLKSLALYREKADRMNEKNMKKTENLHDDFLEQTITLVFRFKEKLREKE